MTAHPAVIRNPNRTRRAFTDRPLGVRVLGWAGLVLGVVAAAVVIALVVGALFDPAANLYAFYSSEVWTLIGPHLILAALIGVLIGVTGIVFGPRRSAIVVTLVTAVALIGSTTLTGSIVHAISSQGGSANPVSALALSSLTDSPADEKVTYTTASGEDLHALIYRPKTATTNAPVMLYIHGGGWIKGVANQNAADYRWFADQGWVVVSVEYRLATATVATWNKAPLDVGCALTWVGAHAKNLGGDPSKIVLAGDSAGGNLAINLGYSTATGKSTSGCGGTMPTPAAVIAMYPVVDPQDAYDHGYPLEGIEPKIFTRDYIGGTPAEYPERMKAISSATYISKKAPPTLIIEPEADGLIPSQGVYDFAAKAKAAGVAITVNRIPFANHGFDQLAGDSLGDQARRTLTMHYAETLGLLPR